MGERPALRRPGPLLAILSALALAGAGVAGAAEAPAALESPIALVAGDPAAACRIQGDEAGARLPVVLELGTEGIPSPALLADGIRCAGERHLELVLTIVPPHAWQDELDPYAALRAWLVELEELIERSGGGITAIILGENPEETLRPSSYAFLVEKVGTLIRSLGHPIRLIVGRLGAGSGAWFGRIHPSRLTPYVSGVILDPAADLGHWIPILRSKLPAAQVWQAPEREAGPEEALRLLQDAREAGASLVMLDPEASPEHERVFLNLVAQLPGRFVPDPSPHPAFIDGDPPQEPLAAFADTLGPQKTIIFSSSGGGRRRIHIGQHPLTRLRLIDLDSGRDLPRTAIRVDATSRSTEVEVASLGGPILVTYVAERGPRPDPETLDVTATYELSAEEIVARLRAFEAGQERHLHHYTASATLSYHYTATALNETIDVSSENRFYWKDNVGEYEELALYVNGARWRGEAPNLPFIQAEKVKEVPIEIRLDTSYLYERTGSDKVGGRPSYVLDFEPVDKDRSLYSGKAWIDKQSFALNRIELLQHGLKPPITSNSDIIEYGWVQGPTRRHWLPVRGYRQMVFTVLGRAVAVEREVNYGDFVVNGDNFEPALAQAYRSERPILRDDEEGYAYLKPGRDGRRYRQEDSMKNIALIGGLRVNRDGQLKSPVAAMNYFDFDWRGTGTQVDVAFAGPFVNAAWTDPALGDSKWELTVEGVFIGVREDFKRSTSGGNQRHEDLETLEERAILGLGRRVGSFSKAELQLSVEYADQDRGKLASSDMVLPPSVWTSTTTGLWRLHRSGFLMELWASDSKRFGWEDWGLDGGLGGEASEDSFQKWGIGIRKSFYPGAIQRISLGATARAGEGLDRLSRFRIGEFREVKVRGWNGADITFDRGVTAHLGYLVSLPRGGMSLAFRVDGAVMENEDDFGVREVLDSSGTEVLLPVPGANAREWVTGASVGLSFKGPWGSLARVSTAMRLGGSLERGNYQPALRLLLVKTFDDWPWKGRRDREPVAPAPLPSSSR